LITLSPTVWVDLFHNAQPIIGLKNPGDLYVGMLQSDTVADALVERFKLQELYGADFRVDARKALAGSSRFKAEKNGIITVEVDAKEPKLAADLANAYVEELHDLTSGLAVTEAAQRRTFFESQLRQTKDRLADAEVALREALEHGGLVSVDAQSRAAVETVARLRAEITAKEVQVGAMRSYATADHPDLRRAEQELASMRRELGRLESGLGLAEGPVPSPGAAGRPGAAGMGNIRLVREVKYQEVLFELLARQYEMARVDESKEAPIIQVLDRAKPPEKRSWPKRTSMVLASAGAAFLAAALVALLRGALEHAMRDPAKRAKVESLRGAWRRQRA